MAVFGLRSKQRGRRICRGERDRTYWEADFRELPNTPVDCKLHLDQPRGIFKLGWLVGPTSFAATTLKRLVEKRNGLDLN